MKWNALPKWLIREVCEYTVCIKRNKTTAWSLYNELMMLNEVFFSQGLGYSELVNINFEGMILQMITFLKALSVMLQIFFFQAIQIISCSITSYNVLKATKRREEEQEEPGGTQTTAMKAAYGEADRGKSHGGGKADGGGAGGMREPRWWR